MGYHVSRQDLNYELPKSFPSELLLDALDKYKQENIDIERDKLESIAETLGIDYTDKNDEALKKAIENEINKNKNT